MKTKEIFAGIEQAETRQELSAHIDLIEQAIVNEACDYDTEEWLAIARAIDEKTGELDTIMSAFSKQVFH